MDLKKEHEVLIVKTEPYQDQIADYKGLIRAVKQYESVNYVENYIQSFFHVLDILEPNGNLKLLTGSDGRYYSDISIQKLIKLTAANSNISKLYIAQNGILTVPAASCFIRQRVLDAGILFTANGANGGVNGDFGIKFEDRNGAPLNRLFTDQIYHYSCKLNEYKICPDIKVDVKHVHEYKFLIRDGKSVRKFSIEVIDSVQDYVQKMKEIFDFKMLRSFIKSGARLTLNCMNGAAGVYAKAILCGELGLLDFEVVKYESAEDFCGLTPEPVPSNVSDLFGLMRKGVHEVGFALGGDGQQFIVIGKDGLFVKPCDALAVIAANLESISYYKKNGVKGFARAFASSRNIDRVAKDLEKKIIELPQNWIHSANLIASEEISLAGDEDYGVAAEHSLEKDGLWAILAWINILEYRRTIVNRLMKYHWQRYGRSMFARYEFDKIDENTCRQVLDKLEEKVSEPSFLGKIFTIQSVKKGRMNTTETLSLVKDELYASYNQELKENNLNENSDVIKQLVKYEVVDTEAFQYEDPFDGSTTLKEVIKIYSLIISNQ